MSRPRKPLEAPQTAANAPTIAQPLLLDNQAVADLLSISPRTVRTLAATGELPSTKIGRRTLWRTSDVVEYVDNLLTR